MSLSVSPVNYQVQANKMGYAPRYWNYTNPKPVEQKTKKLDTTDKILIGLGVIAAAAGTYALFKGGKCTDISKIKWNKGIATLDGKNYTGKIWGNGKRFLTIKCKDGLIIESSFSEGKYDIFKKYYRHSNGTYVETIRIGNNAVKKTYKNITQAAKAGKIMSLLKAGEPDKALKILEDESLALLKELSVYAKAGKEAELGNTLIELGNFSVRLSNMGFGKIIVNYAQKYNALIESMNKVYADLKINDNSLIQKVATSIDSKYGDWFNFA